MPEIDKQLPINLLNTDDAPHLFTEGQPAANAAVNMRNFRFHASVGGRAGYFENILQNMKVSGQTGKIPAGSERVGDFVDPTGKFVVWFTHNAANPGNDQINYYDFTTGLHWLVAKSSLGVYGDMGTGLGFQFGVFYDIEVIDGTIYWTSDKRPRKLHIGAGIMACNPTLDTDDVPFYTGWRYDWVNTGDDDTDIDNISLAAKPPAYPPMIVKRFDSTVSSNDLTGESFQFATQFEYYSKEESTLSTFSSSSLINSEKEKNNNVVEVSINPLEFPLPQGVKELRLYVKIASSKEMFLVSKWDRATIDAGGLLSYKFYGNYYGPKLSDPVSVEPFHSVPDEAKTIEAIKNRLHLGKCKEGKDSPATTSMTMTLGAPIEIESFTNTTKKLQYIMYRGTRKNGLSRPLFYYSGVYVKIEAGELPITGYYLIPGTEMRMGAGYSGIPAVFMPAPATVPIEDLVYKGKDLNEVINNTKSVTIAKLYESYIKESPSSTITVVGLVSSDDVIAAINLFLHNSGHRGGMAFFDRWLKKCGVVTNEGIRVTIPVRNYALSSGYNNIGWSVSNTNAINEIPDWADYYAPLLTRDSRTTNFLTGFSGNTRYAVIDVDGETYKFDDGKADGDVGNDDTVYLAYSVATVGIGIDTTSLINAGLGYTYSKGDMCILISETNNVYTLPVLGSYGKYVLLAAKDIGSLVDKKFIYEIYTPFKVKGQDSYFEVGQLYPISNKHTVNRKYSTLSGSFLPDVYAITRTNGTESGYLAYAMSPNDLYWERWDTHFGRPNVVIQNTVKDKPGNISFSDVFIPGTGVNGLNAFHALNETNLPAELGPISKLQSASKVQGEGSVLIAVCEAGAASIYIGESEIFDQKGSSFLAKSDNVIGQVNPLNLELGTRHPESVKQKDGQAFWYSQEKRAFTRYATNGLFPISDYKFRRATYQLSRKVEDLEAEGNIVMINGGIDPYFDEYLVQMKVYPTAAGQTCPMPVGLVVTASPTEEFPNRVIVSWTQPEDNADYAWQLMDPNFYQVASGFGKVDISNPAEVVLDILSTGINYTFLLKTKCGGDNVSAPAEIVIIIEGEEEEPEGGCVKPTLNDSVAILPDAVVGDEYYAPLIIDGSAPFTISNIIKPTWMIFEPFTYDVHKIEIGGFPGVEDVGLNLVEFDITNCSGITLSFNKSFNVSLP